MHIVAALTSLALIGSFSAHEARAQSSFSESAQVADDTVVDASDDVIRTNVYNRHGMRPATLRRRVADITPQEHWLVAATERLRGVAGSDADAAAALRTLVFSGALEPIILWLDSHNPDAPADPSATERFVNHNHALSALALWAGDLDRANIACDRVLSIDPNNVEALLRKAHIAFAGRDFKAASEGYKAAADITPDTIVTSFNRAMLARQQGDLTTTIELLTIDQVRIADNPALAARSIEERALAHLARGHLERAIADTEQASELYEQVNDPLGRAECMMHRATIDREAGRTRQSEMMFDQALHSFRVIGATRRAAWAVHDRALLAAQRGELGNAEEQLNEALDVSRRYQDIEGVAAHLTALATVHVQLQDWTPATALLDEAQRLCNSIYWRAGIARAQHTRGMLNTGLSHFEKAAQAFREAVAIENELGHARHAAFSALALAHTRSSQGQHDNALRIVDDALSLLEERGIHRDIADAYLARADVRRRAGHAHDALTDYERAMTQFEALGDQIGLATTAARFGEALLVQGKLTDADTMLRKALELDRSMNRRLSVAWTLNDLAELAWLNEDYDDEEVHRREAWDVVKDATDQLAIAEVALSLGAMAHRRRSFSEAVEWYDRARMILEEREPTANLAAIYGNLGLIAHRRREYDQASTLFDAGVRVADSINAMEHQAFLKRCIGDLLRSRNAHDEAVEVLSDALRLHTTLNDVRGMYEDARSLGRTLHRMKRWPETDAAFLRTLDLARQLDHDRWTLEALVNLGDAAFDAGDRDAATDWWIQARDLAHKVRADFAMERIRERLGRR